MKSRSILCISVLLSMPLTGVVEAQALALDIKMGLWEITRITQIRGQIGIDTSTMTPEMRKLLEEATKKVTGETYTTVANECVSKEWLAQWIVMKGNPPGHTCTQTPANNTRASLDVTITCMGESASVSQMHLDRLSSSNFKGAMTSVNTSKGQTSTANVALMGKWLHTDCGSKR
jgi:uncharacterized protein DUF3617